MHFLFYSFYTSRSLFRPFPVNIKILQQAFIHSINLKVPITPKNVFDFKKIGVNARNLPQKFSFLVKTAIFYDFLKI